MESNRTYYFLFKYALLIVGLLIISVPVLSYLFPGSVEINGKAGEADITTVLICGLLGLLSILIFFVIKDKFVLLELKNQTIVIKQVGQEKTITWLDVDSMTQFRFVHPPLYKLKTKESNETLWFNTKPEYISIGGFTSDISDMGELIKKKKQELGI